MTIPGVLMPLFIIVRVGLATDVCQNGADGSACTSVEVNRTVVATGSLVQRKSHVSVAATPLPTEEEEAIAELEAALEKDDLSAINESVKHTQEAAENGLFQRTARTGDTPLSTEEEEAIAELEAALEKDDLSAINESVKHTHEVAQNSLLQHMRDFAFADRIEGKDLRDVFLEYTAGVGAGGGGGESAPATSSCPATCYGKNCDRLISLPDYMTYPLSCSMLEDQHSCDCSGCACPSLCRKTCYGQTCDHWIGLYPVFQNAPLTGQVLESRFNCDCSGCTGCANCPTPAPTPPPTPRPTPRPPPAAAPGSQTCDASKECCQKDPNWQCSGRSCLPASYRNINGWCKPASFCNGRQDAGWCGGKCC
jgi:hypothetical protein